MQYVKLIDIEVARKEMELQVVRYGFQVRALEVIVPILTAHTGKAVTKRLATAVEAGLAAVGLVGWAVVIEEVAGMKYLNVWKNGQLDYDKRLHLFLCYCSNFTPADQHNIYTQGHADGAATYLSSTRAGLNGMKRGLKSLRSIVDRHNKAAIKYNVEVSKLEAKDLGYTHLYVYGPLR